MNIKGVILCGGSGSRLKPLTNIINKHLLPVYNQPMIYWPIQTMVKSGIKDIMLVCGGQNAGDFLRVIGNGEQFGLKHISYTYQKEPKGIADALMLAEHWIGDDPVCVMLGDNILQNPIDGYINEFISDPYNSRILMTEVDHPEWYGVVSLDENGDVEKIVEKPQQPESNLISIGVYMYGNSVWPMIKSLSPSRRNELEITDLNNLYLEAKRLKADRIDGYWGDAGESIDTYLNVSLTVRDLVTNSLM